MAGIYILASTDNSVEYQYNYHDNYYKYTYICTAPDTSNYKFTTRQFQTRTVIGTDSSRQIFTKFVTRPDLIDCVMFG